MNAQLKDKISSFYRQTPDIQWEELKEVLIEKSMEYSKARASQIKDSFRQLEHRLELLQNKIVNMKDPEMIEQTVELIEKDKKQL